MRNPPLLLVLALIGSGGSSTGQVADNGWLRFHYDNDFFNATDRYYTQGIRIEWSAPFVARSPLRHVLPDLGGDARTEHVLFAQQECYTPSSIRRDTILWTDRPFAAALYLGQRSISIDLEKHRTLTTSIIMGVLGPCAICAEEQMGIHRALDNIEPLGWQFQVGSSAILDHSASLDQRLFRSSSVELSSGLGAEAGTYRTNLDMHSALEVGRFKSPYDAGSLSGPTFQMSAFLDGSVRLIGYDATLQGGLFTDNSPHTLAADAIERIVLKGEGGLRLRYGTLALLYSRTFITREFEGGANHGWGSIRLTVMF